MQFNLKKSLDLRPEKHLDYLTGLGLTLWYIGFGLDKYSDYLIGLELILYVGLGLFRNARATSLGLDWFY